MFLAGAGNEFSSFLSHLNGVKMSARGWTALCPAHADKNPSLSINQGERGILLKCWSGCRTEEIVSALGLKMTDLFYDSGLGRYDHQAIQRRQREKKKIEQADDRKIDLLREAEATIRAATGIDISVWTPDQLDKAMDMVSDAWLILSREDSDGQRI
ncbi:MAG: hypothetical protein ACYDBV_04950 [Nitrospiria bacterium]